MADVSQRTETFSVTNASPATKHFPVAPVDLSIDAVLNHFCKVASELIDAPVGLVSIASGSRIYGIGTSGLGEFAEAPSIPADEAICTRVVTSDAPLIIMDMHRDDRVTRAMEAHYAASAYAGVPVHGRDGRAVGSLCVMDPKPRQWSNRDIKILQDLAVAVESQIALQSALFTAQEAVLETRSILDSSIDAFVRIDSTGLISDWNPAAEALFGHSRFEVLEEPLVEILAPPAQRDRYRRQFNIVLRRGVAADAQRWEANVMKADGTEITVEVSFSPIVDGDGGFCAFMHDITQRKATERRLRESMALVESILENSDAFISAKDLQGHYLFANSRLERQFPEMETIIGLTDFDLIPAAAAQELRELEVVCHETRDTITRTEQLVTQFGIRTYVLTTFPLTDADGEVMGACTIAIDDTPNQENQRAREASEAQLKAVVGRLDDFIFTLRVVEKQSELVYTSGKANFIFGGSLPDSVNPVEAVTRRIHPLDIEAYFAMRAKLRSGEEADAELRVIGFDNVVRWIWLRMKPRFENDTIFFDGIATDISDRHQLVDEREAALSALAESESRFRMAFDSSPLGICLTHLRGDKRGRLLRTNTAYAKLTGYEQSELVNMPIADLTHPDDRAHDLQMLPKLASGELRTINYQKRYVCADGSVKWLNVNTSSMVDDEGPLYLVTVMEDITEKRKADAARQKAERDLSRAAKALTSRNEELVAANALKSDLIGMFSHDIGTPLTVIQGRAEMLLDSDEWDPMTRKSIEAIARNATSLDLIRKEVLTMVALDSGAMRAIREPVDVDSTLEDVLSIVGLDIPVTGATGVQAFAQPVHLQQIIGNFLTNAIKYGGGPAAVDVRIEGQQVQIRVIDHGEGVPASFRPHLFERFAREEHASHAANGTGLGLYIVRGLAQANGGNAWHEVSEPQGSTFAVGLRLAEGDA